MLPVNAIRWGHDAPQPERRELRAGPLSLVFESGDLRYIRLGDREVLRRVYVAVRDHNWDTIPIAISDLSIEESETRSLADLTPGQHGHFVRVSDSDPAMLRYLDERGVRLGARLEVLERQPFGGPLTVRFRTNEQILGGALAAAMRVKLD